MQKSFHMAFSTVQRDVHHHMPIPDNALTGASEAELTDYMIHMMDAAEAKGIDLARSVLNKLNTTKRAARNRRASVHRRSHL